MHQLPRREVVVAMLLTIACATAYGQGAHVYPNKPIRIVVPYAPGGATSLHTRAVGQKLTEAWGQSIVVDNRGGAAGGAAR